MLLIKSVKTMPDWHNSVSVDLIAWGALWFGILLCVIFVGLWLYKPPTK